MALAYYLKSFTIVIYVREEEGAKLYRDVMAVGSGLVHFSNCAVEIDEIGTAYPPP